MICCLIERSSQQPAADERSGSGMMSEAVRSQRGHPTGANYADKGVGIVLRILKQNTELQTRLLIVQLREDFILFVRINKKRTCEDFSMQRP